jgi:D-tyrosyl-tRNA(Tyr) deacylase
MIALLQRVTHAQVCVADRCIARIDTGLLVFIAVQQRDDKNTADRLLERVLTYRVFADSQGRMNRSVLEIGGGLLLVPQFTLAADTSKGRRPSFAAAAPSALGRELFDYVCAAAQQRHQAVQHGEFAADMQVDLTNDGPVTFWLQVAGPAH